MSAVSRIMVFPEGLSAQKVLAVDLDDDSVDYFSTYPGTAEQGRSMAVRPLTTTPHPNNSPAAPRSLHLSTDLPCD